MIAINLVEFNPTGFGGVTRYSRSITKAIIESNNHEEITVLCNVENESVISREMSSLRSTTKVHVIALSKNDSYWLRILRSYCAWFPLGHKAISMFLKKSWNLESLAGMQIRLVYTPTTYMSLTVPGAKNLVSLHDTQEKTFPSNFSLRQRRYRHNQVVFTLEAADHIQVSSEFILSEIKEHFPAHISGVDFSIIQEGVDLNWFRPISETSGKQNDTAILPANFLAHKNQKLIVDASVNSETARVVNFKLTGPKNGIRDKLVKKSEVNGLKNIDFVGSLTEEELRQAYSSSQYVVSTSLYESSSLPLLEGIAMNCFPLASNIPPHVEMSRNFHVELFDPKDPLSLSGAIEKVTNLSDEELAIFVAQNQISIKNHSWNKIASEYVKVIAKLLQN